MKELTAAEPGGQRRREGTCRGGEAEQDQRPQGLHDVTHSLRSPSMAINAGKGVCWRVRTVRVDPGERGDLEVFFLVERSW